MNEEKKYREYLENHINAVKKAYQLFCEKINERTLKFSVEELGKVQNIIDRHDKSKYRREEFWPYAKHYHGQRTRESEILYKKAVILHKKRNPHHPEYWLDKNGKPKDMPKEHIVEMVCDWWSFGIQNGDFSKDVCDYYYSHREELVLSDNSRQVVEDLLNKIKSCYGESEAGCESEKGE